MHTAAHEHDLGADSGGNQSHSSRERLRLVDFRFTRSQSGQAVAEVDLEWAVGQRVTGRATGASSPTGDLRISADAALRALDQFTQGNFKFDLVGVKSLRAFDATVIIVAVGFAHTPSEHLLGCYLSTHDPMRGAAVAVLNATNRVIGNSIATS